MQSLPQDNNVSADSTQESSSSYINKVTNSSNQLGTDTGISVEGIPAISKNSNLPLDLIKLIVVGLFIIVLVATFFLVTRGNELCIFSLCTDVGRHSSTLTTDFWAFAGGTATVLVLTTFLGVSLLPAVGIASAVWFVIYSSLHLS